MSAIPKIGRQPSAPEAELLLQIRDYGLPDPETEYRFHPVRKWRADIAFVESTVKLIVEIEGGIFVGGRHSRGVGFESDCEKQAEAMVLGYRYMRVTPRQIKDGRAVRWIAAILQRT